MQFFIEYYDEYATRAWSDTEHIKSLSDSWLLFRQNDELIERIMTRKNRKIPDQLSWHARKCHEIYKLRKNVKLIGGYLCHQELLDAVRSEGNVWKPGLYAKCIDDTFIAWLNHMSVLGAYWGESHVRCVFWIDKK